MASQPGRVVAEASAGEPSKHAAPLPIIWSLLGRHIAFHRRLVDLTDSVKAALLLSQSIYWTRRGRDIALSGGWFHKTTQQWTWETGLSLKEQRIARDTLKGMALIDERRMGVPPRVHFRLAMDQLGNCLSDHITAGLRGADWQDTVMIAKMLGPSVAYHRVLAGIGGGVHAGLMLSRALYLTRIQTTRELDAWINNSAARWFEEIGLSRREQETARRDLSRMGVWEEAMRGMPPRLVARIRLDCLLSLLSVGAQPSADRAPCTAGPVCGETADSYVQKGKTSLWHPHTLILPFPPFQFGPFRHHSSALSAIPLYIHSTSELVQTQNTARDANAPGTVDGAVDTAGGGGGDLIFPDRMQPQECAAARMLLRPFADQAQALLDELAGRLDAQGVRASPVAYLRGLINRARAGTFIAELGLAVAAERLDRQRVVEQRAAREAEERQQAAVRATPDYQARVRAEREKLSQLRDDMRQRMASGRPP